ncbi:MAG: hypothetical protein EXQ55_02410 [Acidobacteria bacterium]|nr:hypothetical protein [Acidobacteriota bacterium]
MAATRAAQLTEAYRTLMNVELRAEYDRLYCDNATAVSSVPSPAAPSSSFSGGPPRASQPSSQASHPRTPSPEPPPSEQPGPIRPSRFALEHATRDEFVRKATLVKFRQALALEVGTIEETIGKGFDFDGTTKAKGLFSRSGAERFAVKFVAKVDRAAVLEAWAVAQKAGGPICLFLMGNGMASARELGDTIGDMRKKARGNVNITMIPVDVRDWSAHLPSDAPAACKRLLQRLRDTSIR